MAKNNQPDEMTYKTFIEDVQAQKTKDFAPSEDIVDNGVKERKKVFFDENRSRKMSEFAQKTQVLEKKPDNMQGEKSHTKTTNNAPSKKDKYLSIVISSALRTKTYTSLQSYKLSEDFGELSDFYFTNPTAMTTFDEPVYKKEQKIATVNCDKLFCRDNKVFVLKKGKVTIEVPATELQERAEQALEKKFAQLLGAEAAPAQDKSETGFYAQTEQQRVKLLALNSILAEDIYNDENLTQMIVYNEKLGMYQIVDTNELELNTQNELKLTPGGVKRGKEAILQEKPYYFATIDDAKLILYGANEPLAPTISSEDTEAINKQYAEMVQKYIPDEIEFPTKAEFAESYIRGKAWKPYQNYKNDRLYEKSTPYALRDKPIFVGWKFEYHDQNGKPLKKPAKMPYNAKTGGRAMANIPATWAKFETAVEAVDKYGFDGIGVMFGLRRVIGIDIDHCIDEKGKISDMAKDVIDSVDSYTEISPSGNGIHIIAFGEVPSSKRTPDIEVYDKTHFFTLTGHLYEGRVRTMKSQEKTQPGLDKVWDKHVAPYVVSQAQRSEKTVSLPAVKQLFSDDDIIKKIEHSDKMRGKFERLQQGLPPYDWDSVNRCYTNDVGAYWYREDGSVDESRIDMAFVKVLVYYNATPEQINRIYKSSPIARDKWDESRGVGTYGDRVIATACSTSSQRYTPFYKKNVTTNKSELEKMRDNAPTHKVLKKAKENSNVME